MKKFFLKLSMLLIAIVITLIIFPIILPKNETNIMHSIEEKHNRLLTSDKNAIVFIGGSNLLYGLDSEMIAEKSKYEVVNMGIHAGLGMRYMMDDIFEYLDKGDILILSMEYEQFYGTMNGEAALNILLKEEPREWKDIKYNQIQTYVKNYPIFIRGQIAGTIKFLLNEVDDTIQNTNFINEYGDLVGHLDKTYSDNIGGIYLQQLDNNSIKYLNDFYNSAKQKGIQVYLSFASLYEREYRNNLDKIDYLIQVLNEKCNIPIISEATNYLFKKEEMFDTAYHLNVKGRERRTNQIIKDLEKIMLIEDNVQ